MAEASMQNLENKEAFSTLDKFSVDKVNIWG